MPSRRHFETFPIPEEIVRSPSARITRDGQTTEHVFSALDMLDPVTGSPRDCACAGCSHVRDARQLAQANERAEMAFDRAASVRMAQHRRERPEEMCRLCGYGGLPHCSRCGKCTRRGATHENIARRRSEYNAGNLMALRNRTEPTGPGDVPEHERVASCCTCPICDTCGDMIGSAAMCSSSHHVGCNCDCWTCPHCAVVRRREDVDRLQLNVAAPVRCTLCSGIRGCCCVCQICQSCSAPQESRARGNIGDLIENRCQVCSRCINCCRCIPAFDAVRPVAMGGRPVFQRGLFRKWDPSPSWGLLKAGLAAEGQANPYKRYIGLEIECAQGGTTWLNHVVVRTWGGNIVQDGSLPHATGFEINTAPAAGDMYVKQVHAICEEFERTGVTANNQCGLHVHVDCSDFNIWDMRRLINLYRRLEASMFSLLPKSRQGNHYCEPCGEQWWKVFNDPHKTRELKGRLSSVLYGVDVATLKDTMQGDKKKIQALMAEVKRSQSGKGNNLRYRALNVHSWFLRGTLEFRMGAVVWTPNTVPSERDIRNWGLVCCSVVEAARRMSDAEVSRVPTSYGSLYDLAPTPDVKRWMTDTLKKLASPTRPDARHTHAGLPTDELSSDDLCPCGDGCNADDCRNCRDDDRNYFSRAQRELRGEA